MESPRKEPLSCFLGQKTSFRRNKISYESICHKPPKIPTLSWICVATCRRQILLKCAISFGKLSCWTNTSHAPKKEMDLQKGGIVRDIRKINLYCGDFAVQKALRLNFPGGSFCSLCRTVGLFEYTGFLSRWGRLHFTLFMWANGRNFKLISSVSCCVYVFWSTNCSDM